MICVLALGSPMPAVGAGAPVPDYLDHGPAEIERCQAIDQPGSYKLVKNLKATGDCLVLTAQGVTIDLGGFALTGDGTGTAIIGPKPQTGTAIPQARTVVRNGDISNFARATDLGGTVEGLRVTSNAEGIFVSVGIVRGNTVQFNTSAGIEIADGIVADNLVIANGTGISVHEAAVITGNEVSGNKIGIDAGGTGSALTANVVDGNSEIGLRIRCPSNLTDNTAVGNAANLVLSDTTCHTSGNLAP
jgi:hypothetical protein